MAIVDLSKTTQSVYMYDSNLVGFGAPSVSSADFWSYYTPAGHAVHLTGTGMTFDAQDHALTGTVNKIAIDIGNNDYLHPDVTITGINAEAKTLDDGPQSFWRILEGNDVITLPEVTPASVASGFYIYGDGAAERVGNVTGGNDIISAGDSSGYITGDAMHVGSQQADTAVTHYRGGVDEILGGATWRQQFFSGDAAYVHATGRLMGGADTIFIQSSNVGSAVTGDVELVGGIAGDKAEVFGGDDYIGAGPNSRALLIGDVWRMYGHSYVDGGDDRINGGNQGETIAGDVHTTGYNLLTGGDDRIWGNGGNDHLIGDAHTVSSSPAGKGKVIAGNDTIYGGEGNDRIDGDIANGDLANVSGGNDLLYGEAGNDLILGGTGNDQLYGGAGADTLFGTLGNDFIDGGSGADRLDGGSGNDTFVVDNAADEVVEYAGQGIDKVLAYTIDYLLGDDVENLTYLGSSSFAGAGNGLDNVMTAGGGNDSLGGGGGNDRLTGGAGNDFLFGDTGNDILDGGSGRDGLNGYEGFDTASYAGSDKGVKVALDNSFTATGDAEGDTLTGIEGLEGTAFKDLLRGDANTNRLLGGASGDFIEGLGGNDVIAGGDGGDILYGGAGNDRFDFYKLGEGGDSIRDFANVAGNDDVLRFDGDAFGGLALGALAAKHFTANSSGLATTADHRFVYETDTGILRFDANGSGNGGVVTIAQFTGAPALAAADFLII